MTAKKTKETLKFVRNLKSGYSTGIGRVTARTLYQYGDFKFFVVSSAVVMSVPETLVFAADSTGEVTNYIDLAGGKRMSQEDAVKDLKRYLLSNN